MARVLALIPDLLFGSRVQGSLAVAGHEVELVGERDLVRDRLGDVSAQIPAVLIVDLSDEQLDAPALVQSLSESGELRQTLTLGFYAHVDPATRERALSAGFDLVVPRSRMARDGVELVKRLIAGPLRAASEINRPD